ncbi:MAG TPA: hypothetical protein VFX05_13465 [Casimicrobiaceae bacterium]|jgi:hypothetical protein|nr:hypothetical protein [Casimicrobiaceae bacterium]
MASPGQHRKARLAERATRQQSVARRTALVIAGLVVAALLGPYVILQLAG